MLKPAIAAAGALDELAHDHQGCGEEEVEVDHRTCSKTMRSGTRRRWQPSGWLSETGGCSVSSAANWSQTGARTHTGTTGTAPPRQSWLTPLPSRRAVPARSSSRATRSFSLLPVALIPPAYLEPTVAKAPAPVHAHICHR